MKSWNMKWWKLAVAMGIMATALSAGTAQNSPVGTPGRPGLPSSTDTPQSQDEAVEKMRAAQIARVAANDRQKRIAADTAKLVTLATELRDEVDKTNKNEMSLDVIRKADEIERLAHDVKQRMKG
jgi:hypothetical protein